MLASLVKGLQPFCGFSPRSWRDLLDTVGLLPEDLADADGRIPLLKGFAAFEAAAAQTGNYGLGIDYVTDFAVGASGPLGFALVNSSNVGEAMRIGSRFVPMVTTMRYCRYEADARAGSIVWQYPGETRTPRAQFVSFGIAAMMDRLAGALSRDWKPLAVVMACDPPRDRARLARHFGDGLRFEPGGPQYGLSVRAEQLASPMREANPRLLDQAVRLAEIEQRQLGIYGSELESSIRSAIPRQLHLGQTNQCDLAAALGITPSRLRAAMREQGLDLRGLIDEYRRKTAHALLVETDISFIDIAFELGFADSSVFTRACRRWFGQAPREIRG